MVQGQQPLLATLHPQRRRYLSVGDRKNRKRKNPKPAGHGSLQANDKDDGVKLCRFSALATNVINIIESLVKNR